MFISLGPCLRTKTISIYLVCLFLWRWRWGSGKNKCPGYIDPVYQCRQIKSRDLGMCGTQPSSSIWLVDLISFRVSSLGSPSFGPYPFHPLRIQVTKAGQIMHPPRITQSEQRNPPLKLSNQPKSHQEPRSKVKNTRNWSRLKSIIAGKW